MKKYSIQLNLGNKEHAESLFNALCVMTHEVREGKNMHLTVQKAIPAPFSTSDASIHNCGYIGDNIKILSVENNWVGELPDINPIHPDKEKIKEALEIISDLPGRFRWETPDDKLLGESCIKIENILNDTLSSDSDVIVKNTESGKITVITEKNHRYDNYDFKPFTLFPLLWSEDFGTEDCRQMMETGQYAIRNVIGQVQINDLIVCEDGNCNYECEFFCQDKALFDKILCGEVILKPIELTYPNTDRTLNYVISLLGFVVKEKEGI